jgi:hypothetical protein
MHVMSKQQDCTVVRHGPKSRHVQSLLFYPRERGHVDEKNRSWVEQKKTVASHEQHMMVAPPSVCHSRRTLASAQVSVSLCVEVRIENGHLVGARAAARHILSASHIF